MVICLEQSQVSVNAGPIVYAAAPGTGTTHGPLVVVDETYLRRQIIILPYVEEVRSVSIQPGFDRPEAIMDSRLDP